MEYCVIGGQYAMYNYGTVRTLLGAKRLATRHIELWDNWQGWHKPCIYRSEDCFPADTFYGVQLIPEIGAEPVSVWNGSRWVDNLEGIE